MERTWIFVLSRWFVMALFKLYFRIEFEGEERVPRAGPVIVAPNHESFLDPLWVSLPIKRPLRYMTWDRMFRIPLLGPLMRAYGAFPVNVDKGDRAALKHSLQHLRAGGGLVIFPEGGRTRDGALMEFKPGVIRLALDTNVPIVPVTIIGGFRAFAPHHKFPRPYKLKIVYHEPLQLAMPDDQNKAKEYLYEQASSLKEIVASALPNGASAC
jgi:1-acyl-sn-glycerol-3-phosphate acyltransferase